MSKLRILALLIVAVMVLTMLGGCTETEIQHKELAYTVLELGTVTDGMDRGKHTSDIPEWTYEKLNIHEDTSAPTEISVTFNGATYTGCYQYSNTQLPNAFVCHVYSQKLEDGGSVYFRIHALTHELTSISIHPKTEISTPVEEAECRKIADAVADDYISLKEYKVKDDSYKDYNYTSYAYTYYREVSGYRTTDSIRIVVHGNGLVSNCDKSMVGTFKNVNKLEIDVEKATAAIKAKLQEVYGDLETVTGYTVKNKQWVKTADDQCGRLYRISVDFRDGNLLYGDLIDLLLI